MSSTCGRWHLSFNGEIYNFRELRTELEANGVSFRTESDTEVLLGGLARFGAEYLPRLAGMFAFAFWDEEAKTGLLARDPFGIKPLYIQELRDSGAGPLRFASEHRALLELARPNEIADLAVKETLRWGSVPEPLAMGTTIRQLRSGHCLKWNDGGEWYEEPYGVLSLASSRVREPVSGESAAAKTREALLESVQRHLVSDVPIGVFLSGGIDSTAVLALTREILGQEGKIRTFSIGFDDSSYDESGIARRTADRFGSEHTEWVLSREEGMEEIPGYLEAMDLPSNDGFNTWCISKLVRKHGIKVALSGLGGDELFGGYDSFQRVPWIRRFYHLLGPLRETVAKRLSRSEDVRWHRVAAFLRSDGSWWDAFHVQRGIFTEDEAEELLGWMFEYDGVREEELKGPLKRDFPGQDWTDRDRVSWMELTGYMRNQLLRDSDVFSMAQGLELRVPLVDARLFESVSRIPAQVRLRRGKQLLLEAVPEVPRWVWDRPKTGFRFPFQEWIEEGFGDLLELPDAPEGLDLRAWYRRWTLVMVRRQVDSVLRSVSAA